ncbi:hypothetical protein DFH11DRAFT_1723784 [Phellopilus nigrolimitatus]|nr:hypothetical protein DFH11DRAFT_1723784 [Phellopilus nigrolimitatus]
MAPRTGTRAIASSSSTPAFARGSPALAQSASTASPQLLELRRQWKWAAVSQFFYTFATLIALEDVTLVDIEEDLVNSTMVVLHRLMQRLLTTLSHDRKITLENWQTALRRQYLRRDPRGNPIGVEPMLPRNSRATTVESDVKTEQQDEAPENASYQEEDVHNAGTAEEADAHMASVQSIDGQTEGITNGEENSDKGARPQTDAKVEGGQEGMDTMRNWADLEMLEKLESIHTVMEWHFQTPLRLRSAMRSDDENASWRIGPIGYDAKRNAYWLIGPDRLWIQRMPPKPPKKSLKRKATSASVNRKVKARRVAQAEADTKMSTAAQSSSSRKAKSSKQGLSRRGGAATGTPLRSSRSSRRSGKVEHTPVPIPEENGRARAAKTRANVKLDLQAKQLAAAKAELQSFSRKSPGKVTSPSKRDSSGQRAVGTRASRRLRGEGDNDDEWQQIPPEWLSGNEDPGAVKIGSSIRSGARSQAQYQGRKRFSIAHADASRNEIDKTWLDSDDESVLTELSDSEASTVDKLENAPNDDDALPLEYWPPSDFIEWETEWEWIAHQFEKSTHYLERALHKLLINEFVPLVTESLREVERQRLREEALMNRKRSSRIAVKETEKESARAAAVKQAEDDEKMARMRRLEARTRKEEEEKLRREQAREQRRREREERELARSRRLENKSAEMEVDVMTDDLSSSAAELHDTLSMTDNAPPKSSRRQSVKKHNGRKTSGDDWELDCEICGSRGINKDEGVPLMSCGKCNRWQHIACHDAIDRRAGRMLRNWDTVDFTCVRCLTSQNGHANSSDRSSYDNHTLKSENRRPHSGHPVGSRMAVNGVNSYRGQTTIPQGLGAGLGQRNGDEIISATSKKVVPYQPQASVTFAHYQPLQRGFSPHPMALQSHRQLQPYEAVHPSLPHPTHPSHARSHASPSHTTNGHNVLSQASYLPRGLSPTDSQHSYSISTNGPVPNHSSQTIQYPHPYPHHQQQTTPGNQAYYHSQV